MPAARAAVLPSSALLPSRAALAALLDGLDDALLLVDDVGNLSFCNRSAMRRLGAEPGHGLRGLADALGPAAAAWLERARGAGVRRARELRTRLGDGRPVLIGVWREGRELALRVHWLPDEAPPVVEPAPLPRLGAGATQEMLRMLWASPFPATLQDEDHRLVAVNDAYLGFAGRTRDALLGIDPLQLVPDEDRASQAEAREAIGSAPTSPMLEMRLIDGQGRERWCRVTAYPVAGDDGRPLRLCVLQDSTAEHVARAQADRSLDELAQWFDLSPTGMLVFDETGLILRSNHAFEALVGQVPVMLADAPPELQAMLGFEGETMLPTSAAERHVAVVQPDGRRQRLSARVRSFATGSGQPRFMAVVEDRSAEEERDLAQLEIGALMDTAGVGVATFDSARGWLRSRARRTQAASRPGLQSIARDMVEADSAAEYERLQQALRRGERTEVRYAVRHPELGRRWLLTRVEPAEAGSGRCTVVTVDATDHENAREALLRQAERTRAILDSVLVGIVTVGDGGIEWMNRSARRMFAGDLVDFVGEPISTVATPEPDHPLRQTDYLHTLAEGQARTFECRLLARDGRTFWVVGNAVVTSRESTGRQLTFALLDIERRRQAEVSIAQTQASLRRILETAPLAIALFDARSQRVLQLNQQAAEFLGQPLEALSGRALGEALAPDAAAALGADLQAALASAEGLRREVAVEDGARWWDMRFVSLPGAAAEQVLLVASDVTEQRAEAEKRYEAAIAQREMLVKEVHHRIKNNLQGVAGLLQHNAARHPEVAPMLTESVGQVQAIAQVYGLQVGASGPLRVASVIEAIALSVQRTFGRPVAALTDGEGIRDFVLPEAESIPIALTINELLTNAVKHGTEAGVRCALHADADAVRLTVRNDGRLPAGFSLAQFPGGVSGLGLVRALLPRRSAALTLQQQGDEVIAEVVLRPPSVVRNTAPDPAFARECGA